MINLISSTNPVSLSATLCDICQGGMRTAETLPSLSQIWSFHLKKGAALGTT